MKQHIRRRSRSVAVVVALILVAATAGACEPSAATHFDAKVSRVVDGDTIVVQFDDGTTDKVRLLGIDTPETHKPGTAVQCYGPEAEQFTRAQLSGRSVRLELDAEERDKYHRLLAYVYVDGRRFEDELLRRGLAKVLIIAPNGRHAKSMIAVEIAAKSQDVGMWGACPATASKR